MLLNMFNLLTCDPGTIFIWSGSHHSNTGWVTLLTLASILSGARTIINRFTSKSWKITLNTFTCGKFWLKWKALHFQKISNNYLMPCFVVSLCHCTTVGLLLKIQPWANKDAKQILYIALQIKQASQYRLVYNLWVYFN